MTAQDIAFQIFVFLAPLLCLSLLILVISWSLNRPLKAGDGLEAMGYSSRAHAFAVFKKVTGLTPTKFWEMAHDPHVDESCVVERCPLVGAVLDRYHRKHRAAGGNAQN